MFKHITDILNTAFFRDLQKKIIHNYKKKYKGVEIKWHFNYISI